MKKVCFIISGTSYSGAEIVLDRYLENNEYIDPFFIIIFDYNNIYDKFIQKYGEQKVECLKILYNKNSIRYIMPYIIKKIIKKLRNSIFVKKCDVIYVNNTTEGILVSKFIKEIDKKTILHIHDMKQCYNHPYNKYIINKYFKTYNEILTVSYETQKSWNPLSTKVIYNGLDEKYFEIKEDLKKIDKIGFVGSLNNRKGADYLIESLPILINSTNIKFFFVFKDYDRKLFSKLKKYQSDRVIILNNLNEKEIIKFYDYIDAIIVPSRLDPLPTVIMEAQARGKIAIGSKQSGIPEMIPKKEFLKEINNFNDIINIINEVININSIDLKKIQKETFEFSKNKFNNDIKKKLINNIIEQL